MSCITELLKLDKKYLSDDTGVPLIFIEGGGNYKNYEYLITFTDYGHRCGYVALPLGHKLEYKPMYSYSTNQKEVDDIEDTIDRLISCHGGVTFFSNDHDLKSLLNNNCQDFWIGFDCAHGFDGKDIETFKKLFGENHGNFKNVIYLNEILSELEFRDFNYVENECKSIIDQLIIFNN